MKNERVSATGFFDVVNVYGLVIALALAAPHIYYARTHKIDRSVFTNRAMLYIARAGRFFSFFLMGFNIGVLERGFPEPTGLMWQFWLAVCGVLTAACLLLWVFVCRSNSKGAALAIAIISAVIVIFSGIIQVKNLLMTAGIVYLAGELYMWSRYFGKEGK